MALKIRDILRGISNKCTDLDAPLYVELPDGTATAVISMKVDKDGDLALEIPE